ncbi:hypothetical protein M438DRAFT_345108 [Aureobasidium pullulans EXF-150]|uniref:Uncharacterized protein n=1 Tax=Aureobasidium pullulans EXF-150 TaxID=1043002 RepID=A0A074XSC8_AURPU|nr:uncharacterized protein M438DRAFT_345108 [Aureobasidium pullulans EXF-150]KEQ84887.1 hypothetical protein M438DRAFT_345108 [Aureobasidium pullulans EXF-150]
MVRNMSSNSVRAPFTVFTTLLCHLVKPPGAAVSLARTIRYAWETRPSSHDETTLSTEASPPSFYHTAAPCQRHGAVSSARDCRVST